MTVAQIDEILRGQFCDPADREYWEQKREEAARREQTVQANEAYYSKMYKYSR